MSEEKFTVPAGKLSLDGNTYQHRETLKKNGWTWDKRNGQWVCETTKARNVPVRKGCRLYVQTRDESGVLSSLKMIYDDGVCMQSTRANFDKYDMAS